VTSGSDHYDLIDQLAESFIERFRQGERPSLEEYTSKYPEVADELREVLSAAVAMEQADAAFDPTQLATTGAELTSGKVKELGDFRVVREIGRGGMGVVYEAEQISLCRPVALKVLPFAAMLDQRQLKRFRNEAQAAATLHHQNIVPVYAIGSDRGVHYFAMQYIEGQMLADVIRDLRQFEGLDQDDAKQRNGGPGLADSLTSGRFAARPLEADTNGTAISAPADKGASDTPAEDVPAADTALEARASISTQRSVKTAAYCRSIAELGIQVADALEHAHEEGVIHRDIKPSNLILDARGKVWVTDFGLARIEKDPGLTMTGDVLGTLRYMSPEQALAKRIVIDHRTDIYSLGITLYELLTLEPAFPGRDREQLIRKIAFEEPVAPRRVNRSVPADLETIILKAMAKNLDDRYESAQYLADDLRRFLGDEPIHARRPSLAKRAAKWCQRHKAFVGAILLLLAIAAVVAPIVAIAQNQLRREAEEQRARAEANLQMALQAVDSMYTDLAEEHLTDAPQSEPLKLEFLKRASAFYREFTAHNSADPQLQSENAKAYYRLGIMHFWLEEFADSEAAFARAISLFESMPNARENRYQWARCQSAQGFLFYRLGRSGEAEDAYGRAISLLDGLVARFPRNIAYQSERAHAQGTLGAVLEQMKRYQEAETVFRNTLDVKGKHVSEFPDNLNYQFLLSIAHGDLARLLGKLEQFDEAGEHWRKAIALLERLIDASPKTSTYRYFLALGDGGYAHLLASESRYEEAEAQYQKAISLYEGLARDFPDTPKFNRGIINRSAELSSLLVEQGRIDESEQQIRQVLGLEASPLQRVVHLHDFAKALTAANQFEKADQYYREAIDQFAAADDDRDVAWGLALSLEQYGAFLNPWFGGNHPPGRADEAESCYRKSIQLLGPLVEDFPQNLNYCGAYHRAVNGLTIVLKATDRSEEIINMLLEVHQKFPENTRVLNDLAWYLATCPAEGMRDTDRAVELAYKAVQLAPEDGRHHNTLGVAYYRTGDWQQAKESLQKSMELLGDASQGYNTIFLAMSYWQLGNKEEARRWYDKAVRWMDDNKPEDEELKTFRAEATELLGITEEPEKEKPKQAPDDKEAPEPGEPAEKPEDDGEPEKEP
jgi:serine/threonine protein kinase/uncharacterized protein HemY